MSGSSTETSTTTPETMISGGATGDTGYGTSTDLFNTMSGMSTSGPTLKSIGDFSSYGDVQDVNGGYFTTNLMDALNNYSNGQTSPGLTTSEQGVINNLMDQTSARGAVSGFGAPTQSALATAIAPTMVGYEENYWNTLLDSLQTGREGDISLYNTDTQRNLDLMNLDLSQNQLTSQNWSTTLSSLASLIELAMPQYTYGSSTTGASDSQNIVKDFFEGFNFSKW